MFFGDLSQGVALGWHITPPWGLQIKVMVKRILTITAIGFLAAAARSGFAQCCALPVSVALLLRLARFAGRTREDRARTGGVAVCGVGV